ncbi:MAG: glutaredoxin family protein [Bacillota bacterium]
MNVDLYSKPDCGVCTAVKGYLRSQGVRFREHDISRNPDALQEMVNLTGGATTVPVVAVGDQAVVGFNKDRLDELLGAQA